MSVNRPIAFHRCADGTEVRIELPAEENIGKRLWVELRTPGPDGLEFSAEWHEPASAFARYLELTAE